MILYSTSKLYHQPYNFQVDNSQFSAVTSTALRFYSSMDKSRGVNYSPNGGLTIGSYTNGSVINDNGDSTQTLRFYGSTYQGNVEGGSLMAQSSSTFPNNNINSLSNYNGRNYSPAYHVTNSGIICNHFRTKPQTCYEVRQTTNFRQNTGFWWYLTFTTSK
jgi:hypothetical protein